MSQDKLIAEIINDTMDKIAHLDERQQMEWMWHFSMATSQKTRMLYYEWGRTTVKTEDSIEKAPHVDDTKIPHVASPNTGITMLDK